MKNKVFIFSLAVLLIASMATAAMKVEDLLTKIREGQSKVKDLQADITTIIKSDMGGKKEAEQKGHIWIKGEDKSKMEMISPLRQISITSGKKMAVINPETGQKFVQDLTAMRKKTGQMDLGKNVMDQTKALEYFNLSVKEVGGFFGGVKEYVISGTPKEKNKFLGRIEFTVDAKKYVPTRIDIYNPKNSLVSSSAIEYVQIKDIWVITRNLSEVKLPSGKMRMEMRFDNIKVNEGMPDKIFEIN
jgi:outer membrane lipoprotein-sorting protein